MVISMDEYISLRRDFIKVAKIHIKPAAFEELKTYYAEAIKSARTLDRIEDVEGLLKVLEKRGVVRYNLVTPLKHIARKYLNGLEINDRLDRYETRIKNQGPFHPAHTNLYQYGNVHYIPQPSAPSPSGSVSNPYPGFTTNADRQPAYNLPQPSITSTSLQTLTPQEEQLQQKVFAKVSREMGLKWPELARRLGVREHYIDDVQARMDLNTQNKTLLILHKFAVETDLTKWKRTLMKALEEARRKGLKEEVEEILDRKY